ncbi:MAG: FAD-dependent oxidoreductase [Deltaproteobacteria bacterium]|nr:FAD-dependent oxidoreductase [Deltaproteobacteria bacterium]MBW1870612.1 FAD-dependent oxidoreductase [Deltaproteobacteria bacterium]
MPTLSEIKLTVGNLRVELDDHLTDPRELIARHLAVQLDDIISVQPTRRSIDARRGKPGLVMNFLVHMTGRPSQLPAQTAEFVPAKILPPARQIKHNQAVAVVGTGPAGLFAAWRLSEAGLRPTLIERGKDFPARHEDIAALLSEGRLEPESNFHFGFGGAGTYSDGKLFTRLNHPGVRYVMQVLQQHGAGTQDEIMVDAQAHVGTDRWPEVLVNLRSELEDRGCSFRFTARVTGLSIGNKKITGLQLADGSHECRAVILAPGNSSRDLFESLHLSGIGLVAKPFAVGVRLTHPQEVIDSIQYGRYSDHPALPPATYRLTTKVKGRGVYTFCMCPGGRVVPTPTEQGLLSLNGMSNSARDSGEANAAVVVSLAPEDLEPADDPLVGIRFQRKLEQAAYLAGGENFHAPTMSLSSLLSGNMSDRAIKVNYSPGINPHDVASLLPDWLAEPLREGLSSFSRKLKNFNHPRAAVLGLETRTSSPVRILRDKQGMSPGLSGLFPAGEGSGYAGGIVSSAVDGIRAADALLTWLAGK